MRLLLLFMMLIAGPVMVWGQKKPMATVMGQVRDSISGSGLEAATISIFEVSDSSLVNYTISDSKGNFQVRLVPTGQQLKLIISFNGYQTIARRITIDVGKTEWRDSFVMAKSFTELDEVIVTAERPPVVFKKDTVEFNAGSFKTKANAVVEDLLKQLPGVEVDKDGN
ncbi:MAG: carboxypeptidase-like regulatory domain-containing protein, partial [Chitinophagaceae bacterium]